MVSGGAAEAGGASASARKRLRGLSRQRRLRDEERAFVIDGPTLLHEALRHRLALQEVFVEPGAPDELLQRCVDAGVTIHVVEQGVLARATDTVTPQPVAAIAAFHDLPLDAVARSVRRGHPPVLVLVGMNDPGNLGTALRSAYASGIERVICCDSTVDPYNPKAVRASAGALFALRVVREASSLDAVVALQNEFVRCLGAIVSGGVDYDRAELTGRLAIVLGNESHGLPDDLLSRLDKLVSIPMQGAESLNVAMAGTLLCFEALRQRRALTRR